MNSPIETGLFLPIRFYDTLAEQNRFKRISEGVALIDEVYIYADCKLLLPFQIVKIYSVSHTIRWYLICIDTEETVELDVDYDYWELYDNGTYMWISYLGQQDLSAYTSNGMYYIQLEITDDESNISYYYSDIFVIRNCSGYYPDDNYRITSPMQMDKRLIDTTDLRIITNP
jgi:hypothetical protein